jgi:hypothetical protein
MKLGTRLPDGVLRLDPPGVDDRGAFQRLDALVRRVAGQLAALGQDPVAIAASPNRFDDARTYEWRAIRCGDFFSERESYLGKHDLDRDILTAPPEARAAHRLLGELQEAGWRDMFADAFGTSMPDQTLSIVVQDKLTWLVFSSNNLTDDEGDPVFAIWEDAELSYFVKRRNDSTGPSSSQFRWCFLTRASLVRKDISMGDGQGLRSDR